MPVLFHHKVADGKVVTFRLRLIYHSDVNPNLAVRLIPNGDYLLLPGIYHPPPSLSEFTVSKGANALKVNIATDQR